MVKHVPPSLEQIAPKWYKKLKENSIDELKKDNFELGNYESCVVGEAHNFNPSYAQEGKDGYCERCDMYGEEIFGIVDDLEDEKIKEKDLKRVLTGFVRHWGHMHATDSS